jgi:hypothetical protein
MDDDEHREGAGGQAGGDEQRGDRELRPRVGARATLGDLWLLAHRRTLRSQWLLRAVAR